LTHGPQTRALLIAKACTRPEPTAEGARRERWTYEELGAEVGMSASQAHVTSPVRRSSHTWFESDSMTQIPARSSRTTPSWWSRKPRRCGLIKTRRRHPFRGLPEAYRVRGHGPGHPQVDLRARLDRGDLDPGAGRVPSTRSRPRDCSSSSRPARRRHRNVLIAGTLADPRAGTRASVARKARSRPE
jgi:hypothetical protein